MPNTHVRCRIGSTSSALAEYQIPIGRNFKRALTIKMKSTEAAANDRQSEDTARPKIMQKSIRDPQPRFGIAAFPLVHALARAPRLEILSVLGAGWAWPRN